MLILGSMPGQKSLAESQYYAHPRNAFWPIIENLFAIDREAPYRKRLQLLNASRVGLWDVFSRCYRPGSLDADIKKQDAEHNDFNGLFQRYPNIRYVFFNGKAAEQAFGKVVNMADYPRIVFTGLPSTSPANASFSFAQKLAQWQQIKAVLPDE